MRRFGAAWLIYCGVGRAVVLGIGMRWVVCLMTARMYRCWPVRVAVLVRSRARRVSAGERRKPAPGNPLVAACFAEGSLGS
jgi:hypothetical protein